MSTESAGEIHASWARRGRQEHAQERAGRMYDPRGRRSGGPAGGRVRPHADARRRDRDGPPALTLVRRRPSRDVLSGWPAPFGRPKRTEAKSLTVITLVSGGPARVLSCRRRATAGRDPKFLSTRPRAHPVQRRGRRPHMRSPSCSDAAFAGGEGRSVVFIIHNLGEVLATPIGSRSCAAGRVTAAGIDRAGESSRSRPPDGRSPRCSSRRPRTGGAGRGCWRSTGVRDTSRLPRSGGVVSRAGEISLVGGGRRQRAGRNWPMSSGAALCTGRLLVTGHDVAALSVARRLDAALARAEDALVSSRTELSLLDNRILVRSPPAGVPGRSSTEGLAIEAQDSGSIRHLGRPSTRPSDPVRATPSTHPCPRDRCEPTLLVAVRPRVASTSARRGRPPAAALPPPGNASF